MYGPAYHANKNILWKSNNLDYDKGALTLEKSTK
jgi:hypothetical protein